MNKSKTQEEQMLVHLLQKIVANLGGNPEGKSKNQLLEEWLRLIEG